MPPVYQTRSSSRSSGRPYLRRSTRLTRNQATTQDNVVVVEHSKPNKRKALRKGVQSELDKDKLCASRQGPLKQSPELRTRQPRRLTPGELAKREVALVAKEQEYKKKAEELDERLSIVKRKEAEASEREIRDILSQLEEHFLCPLCYEFMAHPYTLNPGQCGHTFCALCILKWFFSRLHPPCGGWHESVDCPLCRSLLVITPDRTPRLDITFPFVPNRTAAAVLESMIEKLAKSSFQSTVVKREDSEPICWPLGSRGSSECTKKKVKAREEDLTIATSSVAAWKEGGALRAEWLKRNRDGRREMNNLLQYWSTLKSQDFVALKEKLGV